MTKITIGLPFYNAENYLLEAIKSIFAQTYTAWELILIDDGSTDESLLIAKSIDDPRVRVYSDGHNKGLAVRLNELVSLANCEFIARMDADDISHPQRIEKLMSYFNDNVDIVTCGVYSVLNDLSLMGVRGQSFYEPSVDDLLSGKYGITHAALIARTSWFKRNSYDEQIRTGQDRELWMRAASLGDLKVLSIKEPLYCYREQGNLSKKKMIAAYINEVSLIEKYGERFRFKYAVRIYTKIIVVYILNSVALLGILQYLRIQRDDSTRDLLKSYNDMLEVVLKVPLPRFKSNV